MAIDSRNKRASAGACGLVFLVALPTPDSTIDAADRAHSAGFYSGIAVGITIVAPVDGGVALPTVVFGGGVDAPTLVYGGGVAEPTIVQGGGADEPSFT